MYGTFEHKADVGIKGKGKTIEEAFQEVAKAMFSIECNLQNVKPIQKIKIKCSAENLEELLIEWLNSLLAESSIHYMFFSEFKIKIKENKLEGFAFGEKINKTQELKTEIKAATYSELKIVKEKNNFIVQCIVDV